MNEVAAKYHHARRTAPPSEHVAERYAIRCHVISRQTAMLVMPLPFVMFSLRRRRLATICHELPVYVIVAASDACFAATTLHATPRTFSYAIERATCHAVSTRRYAAAVLMSSRRRDAAASRRRATRLRRTGQLPPKSLLATLAHAATFRQRRPVAHAFAACRATPASLIVSMLSFPPVR